jgi:hypothetical protein
LLCPLPEPELPEPEPFEPEPFELELFELELFELPVRLDSLALFLPLVLLALLDFLVLLVFLVPLLPLAVPRDGELGLVFAVAAGAPSALGASWAAAPGELLGFAGVGLAGPAGWTFARASGAGRVGAASAC